jgi:hypothetical protein
MGEKEKTKPYQTPQKHPNFSKLFSKALTSQIICVKQLIIFFFSENLYWGKKI